MVGFREGGYGMSLYTVPEGQCAIYALVDPESKAVRYVGQSVCPAFRFYGHIKGVPGDRPEKREWIDGLVERRLEPELRILELVPKTEAYAREQEWIARYRQEGAPLVNGVLGGRGRQKLTAAQQRTIKLGAWFSPEEAVLLAKIAKKKGCSESHVLREGLLKLAKEEGLEP